MRDTPLFCEEKERFGHRKVRVVYGPSCCAGGPRFESRPNQNHFSHLANGSDFEEQLNHVHRQDREGAETMHTIQWSLSYFKQK